MKVTQKSQHQYRIQHILFIFLLLGSTGFAGWLSNEYNFRSDWTAGKRHSLSDDTTQLLSQMPFEITVRSYQPDNPTLTKAVNEVLKNYQDHKADFKFKIINPDIFLAQAKSDQVTRYGQTVIEYNDKTERIDNLSEDALSNALIRLQLDNKPQLLFLTQHGERSIGDDSETGYQQLANQLTLKGFDVQNINLINQALTLENSVLVLSSINKPLLDTEQKKILQYIKAGGHLLMLQDPAPEASQLALLAALRINVIDGIVVDSNQKVNAMLKLSHPAMVPILEYKRHPITEKMQYYTLFTTAAALVHDTTNTPQQGQWLATNLLITADTSWAETGDFLLGLAFDKTKDFAGPLSIGIAQQRQITLQDKKVTQRVVVIGDTDFIANNNLGKGANLDFILNTFNWLTQNEKLISIAPKNAPDLRLNLSAPVAALLGLVFLFALPIFFFIMGAAIWSKRRKK
ncbi:hypothetical protein MNBD_GAMMA07-641 [hydrothermal vent metagenome]|uniref:Uncharacterized protein n=1 Tax=hydrothermal vent metagenome TaxID=652676 RepID=A0A3B0WC65_9ZZZZ